MKTAELARWQRELREGHRIYEVVVNGKGQESYYETKEAAAYEVAFRRRYANAGDRIVVRLHYVQSEKLSAERWNP